MDMASLQFVQLIKINHIFYKLGDSKDVTKDFEPPNVDPDQGMDEKAWCQVLHRHITYPGQN